MDVVGKEKRTSTATATRTAIMVRSGVHPIVAVRFGDDLLEYLISLVSVSRVSCCI